MQNCSAFTFSWRSSLGCIDWLLSPALSWNFATWKLYILQVEEDPPELISAQKRLNEMQSHDEEPTKVKKFPSTDADQLSSPIGTSGPMLVIEEIDDSPTREISESKQENADKHIEIGHNLEVNNILTHTGETQDRSEDDSEIYAPLETNTSQDVQIQDGRETNTSLNGSGPDVSKPKNNCKTDFSQNLERINPTKDLDQQSSQEIIRSEKGDKLQSERSSKSSNGESLTSQFIHVSKKMLNTGIELLQLGMNSTNSPFKLGFWPCPVSLTCITKFAEYCYQS